VIFVLVVAILSWGLVEADGENDGVASGFAFFVFGGLEPPIVDGDLAGLVDERGAAGAEDVDFDDVAGVVEAHFQDDAGAGAGGEERFAAGESQARAGGFDLSAEARFGFPGAEFDGAGGGKGVGIGVRYWGGDVAGAGGLLL